MKLKLLFFLVAASLLSGQTALIAVIEFGDYLSATSRLNQARLASLSARYPGQFKIVFRHLPGASDIHARASLLAEQHGLFAALHPQLFTIADPLPLLKQHLPALDIPAALKSPGLTQRLENDATEAAALGVDTPSLLLGGRRYAALPDDASLERIFDTILGRQLSSHSVSIETAKSPTLNEGKPLPELVVFSDFECPYCATFAPVAHQLADAGLARVVFKHFPLSFHARAPAAHRAALFAHSQNKFWAMHDKLFATRKLDRASLLKYAEELNLDLPAFTAAIDAPTHSALAAELAEAERLEVQGTPTVFLNGRPFLAAPNLENLKKAIAQLKAPVATPLLSLYGSPSAPHTLEWFFDAQSTLAQSAAEAIRKLADTKPAGLNIVARHLPLPYHPDAPLAHEALIFAAAQGKFWDFLNHLQRQPDNVSAAQLSSIALRLGLHLSDFEASLARRDQKAAVERDLARAKSLDIRGVPVFILDGKRYDFLPSPEELSSLLQPTSPNSGAAQ